MPRTTGLKERLAPLQQLVVCTEEAAVMLGRKPETITALIAQGHLGVVPHLDTPGKRAIAVKEIERFAAEGVTR